MRIEKRFKVRNPYKADESYTQFVTAGEELFYDYSGSKWVAIDTEYLNLDLAHDKLCLIQIASKAEDSEGIRIEFIWTAGTGDQTETKQKLGALISRKDIEVIMHVATADLPRIEKYTGKELKGKLFDTKVAGKIILNNTRDHGMADIIAALIDPKFVKDKNTSGSQWDLHPKYWQDKQFEYCMNDVLYLHALQERLLEIAERREKSELIGDIMKALPAICSLYHHGLDEKVLSY